MDKLCSMGVKDLWKVLSPVAKKSVPVKSLAGKTLAVDLSGWIVEFRTNQNVPHLYLKTLYQRASRLMKQGVRLVIVADGIAPECKRDAMALRSKEGGVTNSVDRPGFKSIVEKCFEVLKCLGLPCINAPGEAEAYCAWLDGNGLVDGVLTSDSDALLYGARTVYRNLEAQNKFDYAVDLYEMSVIEERLGMTRETLVAMAMLVGCDYDEGIRDIGIEKAQELFRELRSNHKDPFTRIMSWRENQELKTLTNSEEKKVAHCKLCQHKGTKTLHDKEGCHDCSSVKSCDQSSNVTCTCGSVYHQKEKHTLELRYYEKALRNSAFPNKMLVDEFLHANDDLEQPNLNWKPINITRLLKILLSASFKKMAELVVQLQMSGQSFLLSKDTTLNPIKILKECEQNFVKCFQVQWSKLASDRTTQDSCYTVTVEQDAFSRLYGEITQEYRAEVELARKKKEHEKETKKGTKRKNGSLVTDYFKVKKRPSTPESDNGEGNQWNSGYRSKDSPKNEEDQ